MLPCDAPIGTPSCPALDNALATIEQDTTSFAHRLAFGFTESMSTAASSSSIEHTRCSSSVISFSILACTAIISAYAILFTAFLIFTGF